MLQKRPRNVQGLLRSLVPEAADIKAVYPDAALTPALKIKVGICVSAVFKISIKIKLKESRIYAGG